MMRTNSSASVSRIARPGWPVTKAAQRFQKPLPSGFGLGCRKAGRAIESMWRPTSDSSAGSSVIAASTAVRTENADA